MSRTLANVHLKRKKIHLIVEGYGKTEFTLNLTILQPETLEYMEYGINLLLEMCDNSR